MGVTSAEKILPRLSTLIKCVAKISFNIKNRYLAKQMLYKPKIKDLQPTVFTQQIRFVFQGSQ